MRLHLLVISAIVSEISAFAPIHTSTTINANNVVVQQSSSTSLSMKSSDLEQAKKSILSIFAASTIFFASTAATPSFIDPAFAITSTTTSTTTSTATTTKAAPVVDPLAAEKTAVENAKKQATTASAEAAKAKKTLGEANTALAKATEASSNVEKKVVATKKALIVANDKLADAKAREGKSGDMSALKEVENLAIKVGTFYRYTLKTMDVVHCL